MSLTKYAVGNEIFKNGYYKENKEKLLELVEEGQKPQTLFIACSDSRVTPDRFTNSEPGEFFNLRNVGNFVPPYKPDEDFHGSASVIEYATLVLNVKNIIVCGHSFCGACEALYAEQGHPEMVHTKKWLSLGMPAKAEAVRVLGVDAPKKELFKYTERESVKFQLKNLMTYPFIKKRVEEGNMNLYGWFYKMEDGEVYQFDEERNEFLPLKELY